MRRRPWTLFLLLWSSPAVETRLHLLSAAPVVPNSTRLEEHSSLPRKAYLLRSQDAWRPVLPSRLTPTSRHDCSWTINGAPFHRNSTTWGVLVTNGTVRSEYWNQGVGLGTTRNGHYAIGTLESLEEVQDYRVVDFITGFDWLVEKGINVADHDESGVLEAPRTAMGVDREGRWMALVADGCERWYASGRDLLDSR